ncbi:hypothetical protein [Rhizobium phaseoli]|uniref:hypothetical protein n=1 Tax=Rhizobium phaseoli TaxID=396 RepID=UPI001680796E|nr:hypothetical protein [Rhizobium phaseoli]
MGLEHAFGVREHQRRRGFLVVNISQGSQNREKADSRKKFGRPTQNARHSAAPLFKRAKDAAALQMMA